MPFPPEVNSFQAEISGDQQLVARQDREQRAVIADADSLKSSALVFQGLRSDSRDQLAFG